MMQAVRCVYASAGTIDTAPMRLYSWYTDVTLPSVCVLRCTHRMYAYTDVTQDDGTPLEQAEKDGCAYPTREACTTPYQMVSP